MANESLLTSLQLIRKSKITRHELSHQMGLSVSMVSKLTGDLMNRGLIHEIGRAETGGRRSSGLLALNPRAGYVIGLDISGMHQKAVVVDLTGQVISGLAQDQHIPADRQAIVDGLDRMIQHAIETCNLEPCQIFGVGVGLWATVDPKNGSVSSWTETPDLSDTWKDFALRENLLERWSFPHVVVDDIVRSLGIAEAHFGQHGHGDQTFVYLLVDSGIGMAIMFGDTPFIGEIQIAGEIGHIPLANVNLHCNCGNVGCLETVASATAITERARRRLKESSIRSILRNGEISVADVISAADAGDKLAYQVLIEAGEYLGIGLAITVNMLGPALIVVGGALSRSTIFLDAARRTMRLQTLSKAVPQVRVEASKLDDLAGARGAAAQVLGRLFGNCDNNLLVLKP